MFWNDRSECICLTVNIFVRFFLAVEDQDVVNLKVFNMTLSLSPSEIHFSHDSIGYRFSCGRFIEDTYTLLHYGLIDISCIPRMTVTLMDGKWFAYNGNRRLWVFRKLASEGKLQKINVYVTEARIPKKRFTTQNGGITIEVRGRSDFELSSFLSHLSVGGMGEFEMPQTLGLSSNHSTAWWWTRFEDTCTKQSFDGSGGSGSLECLALSHDRSGYFYLMTDGFSKYRQIPQEVISKIWWSHRRYDAEPIYVALGDNGRYYMEFSDGNICYNASKTFGKELRRAWNCLEEVYAVAFAPNDGWWISTSSHSSYKNLPISLSVALSKEEYSAEYISVSSSGAWFAQFSEHNHRHGLDEELEKLIKEQEQEGQHVTFITFGGAYDTVIEFHSSE